MKTGLLENCKGKKLYIILLLCLLFSAVVPISAKAEEVVFEGVEETDCGDLKYSISAEGHLKITGTGTYAFQYVDGQNRPLWYDYREYIKTAEVSISGMQGMQHMFFGLSNLESIDFTGTDTSNVVYMNNLFNSCSSLKSLDLSGFDTRNVTDMENMFNECASLERITINKEKFNTANVTNMSFMFAGCEKLQSIDLSGFKTGNVTHMWTMFGACKSLKTLDLSSFDTGNVTWMAAMFAGCSSLESIKFGKDFSVEKVTQVTSMFNGCKALKSIDLSNFKENSVTSLSSMFVGCSSLTTISFPKEFDTSNVTSMLNMFQDCSALETVDISGFDTTKVTTFGRMFGGCSSLKTLDLSHFNTTSVTNTAYMFSGCKSLESVDLSSFDTSKVTYMVEMFAGCQALKELDLSHFDTTIVTSMVSMFENCSSLEKLDVSSFNTGNVTDMRKMFSGCHALKEFNLSSFNASKYSQTISLTMNNLIKVTVGSDSHNYKLTTRADSWIDDAGNIYEDGAVITPIPGSTLYIYRGVYNINYVYDGELVDEQTSYTMGEALELSAYVTKEYCEFDGWYTDAELTKKITEIPADIKCGDITLYAKMVPQTFNISYKNIDGISNSNLLPASYAYGMEVSLVVPLKNYYTFGGWYEDAQFTKPLTKITAGRSGDITLYAKMTPQTFTVSYKNIDGISNKNLLAVGYTYGTETTVVLPLKNCHVFNGWYLDAGYKQKFIGITKNTAGNIVLYAKWTPNHAVDRQNGTVTKGATTTTEGEIRYKCKNCSYTETEKIPRIVTEESQITDESVLKKSDDGDMKGSAFVKFQARADKTTKKTIRLKWNKVKGADGYKIYGNKCGKKNKYKLLKNVKDGDKTTWTQKKRKKGTYYKYIVRAYKIVDGKEITLAVSKTIHATTTGAKYGNAKSLKITTDKKMKKTSSGYKLTLKKNKKYTIKVKEVSTSKKIDIHRKIKFESSNKKIATVSSAGKVKAKKAGTCYIYAYAQNGVYKKIKVVVK